MMQKGLVNAMQAYRGIYPVLSLAASQAFEKTVLGPSLAATRQAICTAGQKLAQAIREDFAQYAPWPAAPRVLVLCGKGHNGADALQAAYHLALAHPQASIDVVTPFDPSGHQPLTQEAWQTLHEACGQRVSHLYYQAGQQTLDPRQHWDLCLDGLLGLGSNTVPLSVHLGCLIQQANQHPNIGVRVAIDLPSGLISSLESQQPSKSSVPAPLPGQDPTSLSSYACVFKADFTYCLGTPKAPLLEPRHQPYLGRLRYLDLGFFNTVPSPTETLGAPQMPDTRSASGQPSLGILTSEVLRSLQALRNAHSDKRHYGHLVIVAGSPTMPGALALSTRAALQAGVGKVTALYPKGYAASLCALAPEAMLRPQPPTLPELLGQYTELLQRCTAILIGPGLGLRPDCLALVQALLEAYPTTPLVLDADALQPGLLPILTARSHPNTPVYLTPHLGEARRLLGSSFAVQPASLAEWAQTLQATCQHYAVQLLLKGTSTYVCDSQHTWISLHGSAVLAKGGSGDVLSGLLAGLVAQASAGTPALVSLAQAAVWHGLASTWLAAHKGQRCPVATDLVEALGPALRCTYPF